MRCTTAVIGEMEMNGGVVCSCSSPDCMVNGCAQVRRLRRDYGHPTRYYQPVGAGDGNTYVPGVLTANDVREIVRAELARAIAALSSAAAVRQQNSETSGKGESA